MSKPHTCSSCKQWGGCPAPNACQVPESTPSRPFPWFAAGWSLVAALAIAAAVVPFI